MEAIHEVQKLLPSLSRGEKAQVLKWVVQDLGDDFPGIDSSPSVCGGDPCIVRTRIPVWLLERYWRLGVTERDLLDSYPTAPGRGPSQCLGLCPDSCCGD